MSRLNAILLAAASLSGLLSAAQASGPDAAAFEEIVVTADPLRRSSGLLLTTVDVLQGDALVQRRQGTLGETLAGLPGVSADSFGSGASRPVIRGQTAPRVKVLSDGAAILDASEVSPDHAISGEPLLLERIEILRGPSTLLYGGNAIGGGVNLIDTRIATTLPEGGASGVLETRLGSADGERAGVLGFTLGAGPFALRLEAAARQTDDYDVPDWRHRTLEGSASRSTSASLGLSWVGDWGFLGAAYTEQRSDYGLPGHDHAYESCHPHGVTLHCGGHGHDDDEDHHHHDDEDGHEDPPIVDLVSRRVDLRGELVRPFEGVEAIRLRGGWTDYAHDEIDDGLVATTFANKGHDGRIEVQHAPFGDLRGVIGMQVSRSDMSAVGREEFLPQSRTDHWALFILEELELGDWRLEGALRQEWQETRATDRPGTDHAPFSVSGAASWSFAPGWSARLSLARSQRAPSVQELYARGVHLATNTYEMGDADLDVETANSVELSIEASSGPTRLSASVYHYAYEDYIHARTLDRFEDFRLIRYAQDDARFTGIEAQIEHDVTEQFSVTVFGDYVRARFAHGGGDLPRIPAGRLGIRGNLQVDAWSGQLEYTRVLAQDRIAAFETRTPGHDMVNATLAYDFQVGGLENQVFVRATNLLDELAYNHASFITDLAPLRGRNVVIGLRARF